MNYEQAKYTITQWKVAQADMRIEIAKTKEEINEVEIKLMKHNKMLSFYETLPPNAEFFFDNQPDVKMKKEVEIEQTKGHIKYEEQTKVNLNCYLCLVSHVHNGDMGRATRSAMKFKQLQHERLEYFGNDTNDLWYKDNEVGFVTKEGAYNEIAKALARTTKKADQLMENLEIYLTAREVKQAKKNMRKRKKKKN